MADVRITALPAAQTITGSELVPVVQNGLTVQTTVSAITQSPSLTQTFLTVNQTPNLPNSRYFSTSTGIGITDGGAQGAYRIALNGTSGSLETATTGFPSKTAANTIVSRTLTTSGNGVSVTNGDGIAGNPVFQLTGLAAAIANASGTGILGLNGSLLTPLAFTGTSNQINVVNGNGAGGNPTISIANNAIFPGTAGVTLPNGTTAQRGANQGEIRYNTDTSRFEGLYGSGWQPFGIGDGSLTSVSGTANQIVVSNVGTISTVGLSTNPIIPGSAAIQLPSGTTAQRPGGVNGQLRYNTTTQTFEGYANGVWGAITAGSGVTSVATGTGLLGGPITSTGTISIDNTVVATLNDTQTLTNKTLVSPIVTNSLKFAGSGVSTTYTPFVQTFASYVTNFNGYQLNYIENQNNGSNASVDYVAYNDASDVNSYFVDMGISSSNFTDPTFTVFPPNGGYLYTGGGLTGQASALLLGTSNPASDITMFTGGTLLANTRATIKGNTGNFLVGTTTDTGYGFNAGGTSYFGGAATFGSTVLLNSNPTLALQAATKQYVDSAASTGFTVHNPVVYATTAALPANTYNNGSSGVGATLTATTNGALSVDSNVVTSGQRILVKNESASANNGVYTVTQVGSVSLPYILTRATDFNTAAAGNISNNAYFFVTSGTVNTASSYILSQTSAITVGTTSLPFSLFYAQTAYSGGTNITVAGSVISVSGTIAATLGGTGTSTVTTGDLLYGSGTNTWSKLPLGSAYKSLVVNASGTQVQWNAVALDQSTAVSGALGVSNGGTGVTSSTGTGSVVLSNAPNLISPNLDTPTVLVGTNITGTAAGLTAGNVTTNANLTGAVTSVGNATSLGSFSSAQLATALTDETGTGAAVFATSPTLVTPNLGTPSTLVGTNITGTAASLSIGGNATTSTTSTNIAGGSAGSLPYQSGSSTTSLLAAGTNGYVLTMVSGNPAWAASTGGVTSFSAGTTGLTPSTSTTGSVTLAGTLAVANGGTGVTTSTGSGANVLGTRPTIAITGAGLTLQDATDNTKQANFDLSGLTTGTTYSYVLPAVSGAALATLGNVAQTFVGTVSTGTGVTTTSTTNIATGATASGQTNTINFGTGALTGSTTTINFGNNTGTQSVYFSASVTFSNATTFSNAGTSITATSLSVGSFTVGGASQTGTNTFGQSTVTGITNIASGATSSGNTKTLNLGANGASGSTTNINIGSSTGTVTTTINGNATVGGTFTCGFGAFNLAGATGYFGQSTGTGSYGFGVGATASGSTKTLSIGNGGLSGSTTTIAIGGAFGSTTTITGSTQVVGTGYSPNITLADAATIAWDTSTGQVATFTFVSTNRTVGAPTNLKNGAFYALAVIQNAGSNTLTWNAIFKWAGGVAPTLSTAANAQDYFTFRSDGTNLYQQGISQAVA